MTTTILKTHDLSIKFGGVTAVDCVNIEAHDNELIGLIEIGRALCRERV